MKALQSFQRIQMGETADHDVTLDTASRSMSLNISLNKKKKLGGPMNVEELKMNKMLLKEIHAAKKAEREQS